MSFKKVLSIYFLNLVLNPNAAWADLSLPNNYLFDRQSVQLLMSSDGKNKLPVISPITETRGDTFKQDNSDADDPAIYVHPQDAAKSFVIATFKKGGLGVFDLIGKEIQSITPKDIRYNNVDIVYGVEYQSQIAGEKAKVDLAIASDRINDTIAVFLINPNYGVGVVRERPLQRETPLRDVSVASIPKSIFGIDNQEATAYGLTAYTDAENGKGYVFVSQSDGNEIAQLELQPRFGAADNLEVGAKLIRTFELPIPEGVKPEEAFVEGMVVDKETGILYLAQEKYGIWQMDADPNQDLNLTIVDRVTDYQSDSPLVADIEGLTIYYGNEGQKYLIASSQGDSTFAAYDLLDNNSYWGSFAIDRVKQTDGLDVTNIPLGEAFPQGLLVVQDGVNQPKPNFKFINPIEIFPLNP